MDKDLEGFLFVASFYCAAACVGFAYVLGKNGKRAEWQKGYDAHVRLSEIPSYTSLPGNPSGTGSEDSSESHSGAKKGDEE